MNKLARLRPDKFTLALVGTVVLDTVLPCRGWAQPLFETLTTAAIALLFFLHGAKLSREAILTGMGHWHLHLMVLASTFLLFPAMGLLVQMAPAWAVKPAITAGVLYLC